MPSTSLEMNQALFDAIVKSGMKMVQIAKACGFDSARLSKILHQYDNHPTAKEKSAVAQALGKTVEALFPEEE